MEKRALIRNHTQITVACSSLTPNSPASVSNGIMLNCSCGGTCIETNRRIHDGNIVMIKATGSIAGEGPHQLPEGFRTLALAEVKWSRLLEDGRIPNYAIGLMYLPN
jgi:hypothetical protein